MKISRRSLRKALILAGCVWGQISPTTSWVGVVLITLGGGLHWLSKAYLQQNRDLTTAGPYRFTRNPFYLANLVIDAGIACVIGELWIAVVYFSIWGFAYSATIREEEARLRELFGARFEDYAAVVPRFFPTRKPLAAERARGRFDLANPSLAAGREYARLLGIALAPATLWAAEVLRRLRLDVFDEAHGLELGLALLVPALWVSKLALAEAFRRPGTRLHPFSGRPRAWIVASLAVSSPLMLVGLRDASVAHGVAALGLALALVSSVPFRRAPGLRLVGKGTLALAALLLGGLNGAFWSAILPALWFAISMLDEFGGIRIQPGADSSARADWRYFPRIAAGAVLGMLVITATRL